MYKLNDFRNEIVHRLGHKDYKIDSYGHNFFVNAMAEMKELIINDYSHFSSRLSDLELNLQTKFFDDLKENEMTNLIKQVYGDGFYETKVKVRFVTIKTDVNEYLIIRVAKSLSGKTKSEREELLKHGFTIVLDPNPKAIEEKFRHTSSSIWKKWKELGFGQQKILYKTIKNTRTIETKDKEWWEKTKNSFCYTDEFVRKIDPKLLDE
jgi:hypothetical protein